MCWGFHTPCRLSEEALRNDDVADGSSPAVMEMGCNSSRPGLSPPPSSFKLSAGRAATAAAAAAAAPPTPDSLAGYL